MIDQGLQDLVLARTLELQAANPALALPALGQLVQDSFQPEEQYLLTQQIIGDVFDEWANSQSLQQP